MTDVANEAGVSQTTVSLVLNHADGARLSVLTRERVHKAAAKIGYRMVRRGGIWAGSPGATTVGFVCDEISTDPWTAIGLDGVREKAWEHGLTVSVAVTRGDPEIEQAALAMLEAQPLAGLIYAYDDREIARYVHAPLSTVVLPHLEMGTLAAEMLLETGTSSSARPRQIKVECPLVEREWV
jgi:DNA-binding LacI/PurR family transcriptional regulator